LIVKLKVGKISYANTFPVFYALERDFDCSEYEFVEGVPSALNGMIRNGAIDVSWSSSVEYLRHPSLYDLVPNYSISSKGPVMSIILFSTRPIEDLDGSLILTSSQSETSAALVQVVMNRFYGLKCRFQPASDPIGQAIRTHQAYLLIGDGALTEKDRWPDLFKYDLGDIWYRKTGLPFVFALWIIRKGCRPEKEELVQHFIRDLDGARRVALGDLKSIAKASPLKSLTEEELISYWNVISYDFAAEHKAGLELFRQYAGELGLI
jgi:chorismate dehydratase